MIAYLKGQFTYKSPATVHVEVGGVGYEVQISLNTYTKLESLKEGKLFTWLHIREDAHVLYGFHELAEKEMFLLLIGVSGVGAATARVMLSSLQAGELAKAIARGDAKTLEAVKGIGKKTAERLVLELKDKVGKSTGDLTFSPLVNNTLEQEALNALLSLGISRPQAEQAVKKAVASAPAPEKVEDLVKKALKLI